MRVSSFSSKQIVHVDEFDSLFSFIEVEFILEKENLSFFVGVREFFRI